MFIVIATWLFSSAMLHPVHETVMELEWNPATKRLEVAVRLHSLDEQWIRRKVDREAEIASVATRYVQSHVRINVDPSQLPADGDAETHGDTYHWIGREEDGAHVWWYFEIDPKQAGPPRNIENTMLFDCEKNYAHRVVVLGPLPRLASTLTISCSVMDLAPVAEDVPALKD